MNIRQTRWLRRYETALCKHLKQGPRAGLNAAIELGREAVTLGLQTLDVARAHGRAMTKAAESGGSASVRQRIVARAKTFFAEAIVPIEKTHRAARSTNIHIKQLARTLRQRTMESSASAKNLEDGISQRRMTEAALKTSGKRNVRVLADLRRLQKHLRRLTREILLVQEDRQQKISRQLHNDIAQTLLAINIRLLTLKNSAKANTTNLKKEIGRTQQLVKESVRRVNRFAHECGIRHET